MNFSKNKSLINPAITALAVLFLTFWSGPTFAEEKYRLGPNDVLKIEVWGEPDLSGDYSVNEQGFIRRSWLPEIKVMGLTLDEANQSFEKAVKKFVKEPRIKMEISEYKSHRISMIGGVMNPGQYTLAEKSNFLSLLLKAGGLAAKAKGDAIVLRSSGEGELNRLPIDVSKLLNQADKSQDIALLHGDVVYFPMASEEGTSANSSQSVIVTGAVIRMGSYAYREGYTALNAILDAGGFSKFAAPNRAKVVRGQGKEEKVIRVELGDVVNRGDKTKDVALMPGDIVVVPEGIL